ncbi:hypothetical protein P43SY_005278 [Pythium insidiosum]|uniref:tRNA dimethylallyltransferase n=1 Tax=Pythium insidiosum TaxID=114742 RepID=A0AAD5M1H4_PYTIN|nr:hypothetical protein P43SY_005278 [Pythium insidiosum]
MAASLRKVLVIVGTTGAGKTKLSIDLAKAVGGEIINSDAMQMYRGLDIATAKVTEQEKDGVPHHLLDIVDPSGRCDVLEFKRRALLTIDEILARGNVPIIVGGTMYYTQSILWKSQLLDDVPVRSDAPQIPEDATPEDVYARLQEVDPVMASRWHVRQTRRVRRSLEVFYQTGVPHSEHIARQERANASMETYFDACALWVHCDKTTLADRLEKRVDKMMDTGLVEEIKRLRAEVHANPPQYRAPTAGNDGNNSDGGEDDEEQTGDGPQVDYQVGILQAIGYKEFAPYLDALDARKQRADTPDDDEQSDDELRKLFDSCVEQLNIATRQYARRQLSWIRNRFATRNIPVYQVDSSDVSRWDEHVATPAIAIARSFLRGEAIASYQSVQESDPERYAPQSKEDKYKETICEICGDRKFVGKTQWEQHVKSKGHRYHVRRVEIERKRALTDGEQVTVKRSKRAAPAEHESESAASDA